jgi:hypothetical protein
MASGRQLCVGDEAPDLTAQTSEGAIRFHEWLGESWGYVGRRDTDCVCSLPVLGFGSSSYLLRRMLFTHSGDLTPGSSTVRSVVLCFSFPRSRHACQQLASPWVGEFAKRNVKIIGLSCDALASPQCFAEDSDEVTAKVAFPIVRDPERTVARLYGMLGSQGDAPEGQTIAQFYRFSHNPVLRQGTASGGAIRVYRRSKSYDSADSNGFGLLQPQL